MALLRRIPFYKIQFLFYSGAPDDADVAPNGSLAFNTSSATAPVYVRKSSGWVESTTGSTGVSSVFGRTGAIVSALGDYPPAKLGSGTANSTTYLRGDGTWAGISGGASAATSAALGTVKIAGTPTDAANPTAYVTEQTDTLLAGKAALAHTHAQADVTGLIAALGAKSDTTHTHAFADLTSRPTTRLGYGITDAAAATHTHAASDLASGTVATARLGSGTANATTFLRGDQTWAAPAGGSDPWTVVALGADFTTSSATAVDVTGLSFTPAASTRYMFEAMVFLRTATATVNPRLGLGWPTAGITDGIAMLNEAQTATTQLLANGNSSAAILSAVGGVPNATQSWPGYLWGTVLMTTGPAGSVRVQLASETAGTVVTVKAGSYLKYRTY